MACIHPIRVGSNGDIFDIIVMPATQKFFLGMPYNSSQSESVMSTFVINVMEFISPQPHSVFQSPVLFLDVAFCTIFLKAYHSLQLILLSAL